MSDARLRRLRDYRFTGPQKRKGRYYYMVTDPASYDPETKSYARRSQFSLGTTDQRKAQVKLADLERRCWMGEFDPFADERPTKRYTIEEATERFIDQYTDRAKSTRRQMRTLLRAFASSVGATRPARSVTAEDVERFLTTRSGYGGSTSPYTLQRYHRYLRQVFDQFVEWGVTDENPVETVDVKRPTHDTYNVLTVEQVRRLLQVIEKTARTDEARRHDTYVRDGIILQLATGMRQGELRGLRWADVRRLDSPEDVAEVIVRPYAASETERGTAHTVKNQNAERVVPVFPIGTEVLRRLWRNAQKEGTDTTRHIVLRSRDGAVSERYGPSYSTYANEIARLERSGPRRRKHRPHDLRHTFISWCVNELSVPLQVVAEWVGHNDTSQTDEYVHVDGRTSRHSALFALGRRPASGTWTHEKVLDFLNGKAVEV